MKRILIVDDHVVVRDGVKRLLENHPGGIAFGDAENAAEAETRHRTRLGPCDSRYFPWGQRRVGPFARPSTTSP